MITHVVYICILCVCIGYSLDGSSTTLNTNNQNGTSDRDKLNRQQLMQVRIVATYAMQLADSTSVATHDSSVVCQCICLHKIHSRHSGHPCMMTPQFASMIQACQLDQRSNLQASISGVTLGELFHHVLRRHVCPCHQPEDADDSSELPWAVIPGAGAPASAPSSALGPGAGALAASVEQTNVVGLLTWISKAKR